MSTFLATIYAVTLNDVYVSSERPCPVTNYFGHLVLWILVNSGDRRYDKLIIQAITFVIDWAEREELKPFFHEAIVNKNLTLPLATFFHVELLYEDSLYEPLDRIVHLLCAISVHCPLVLRAKDETSPQTLMQCIRTACQRQICLSINDEETNGILAGCLNIMRYKLLLIPTLPTNCALLLGVETSCKNTSSQEIMKICRNFLS